MARSKDTPPTMRRKLLLVPLFVVATAIPLGLTWYMREPGRVRTQCWGATHVASPGYFHKGWCLQREVTTNSIDADGAETTSTGWGGKECYATEAEAYEACTRGKP